MKSLVNTKLASIAGLFGLFATIFPSAANAGWEVEWIDKFDGNQVNWQNWTAQVQANYNNEVQCYTDDETSAQRNLEVSNGTLKIIAHKKQVSCEGLGGQTRSWTSARLNSKDKREFLYGRIETRLKFNTLDGGVWPAFWALENRIAEHPFKGDNDTVHWPNPGAGEIDIWEWFSNQGNSYITNFFNTNSCGSEYRPAYPGGASDVLDFHVYAMEWSQQEVRFYMNENLVQRVDIQNCPQYKEPMFLLINLAIGGNLGGTVDPALTTATLEVDYIAHCSVSESNNSTFCNEQTPVAVDTDGDGISDNLDLCPATPSEDSVDMNGCTQVATIDAPEVAAPIPSHLQDNVVAIFSDEFNTITDINYNPNWGQATSVSTETIDGNSVLKYLGLNYQGTGFENNPQNLSEMDYLHVDYWTKNSTALRIFLISPGPEETAFDIPLNQNQWQSVDIPLSQFAGVDLTDVFQLKVEGNGTVFLDNIYFYKSSSDQPGDGNGDGQGDNPPVDSDNDGVNDDVDQCPNSTSTTVDNLGCEIAVTPTNLEIDYSIKQGGNLVSTIIPSGGEVTITLDITGTNNEDFTLTWSNDEEINGVQNGTTFSFDPKSLSGGKIQLEVTIEQTNGVSASANINLTIAEQSKGSGSYGGFLLILGFALSLYRAISFGPASRLKLKHRG